MLEKHNSLGNYLSTYVTPGSPRRANTHRAPYQGQDQGGRGYPTLIVLVLFMAGLVWSLSSLPAGGVTAAPIAYTPASELFLSGSLVGLTSVQASCSDTGITISNTVDAYAAATLPLSLSFTTAAPMTDAYYNLSWPQASLELSMLDASGQAVRTFRGQEGSVDVRGSSVYLSALLYDESGALLNLSGQVNCQ
ncbi:MAG: hypothetical protein AAF267_16000 [Deinococcota bacterium]